MAKLSIINNRSEALEEACKVLAAGELVALPTETVYGLAGDATNGEAVARIFETKGRPRFNPLICHMSGIGMAQSHVVFNDLARKLAETFWPGPLTLVLPKRSDSPVHPLASAGLETLAVRTPAGFANELIERFGNPLAAPSANRSGKVSPTRAEHVEADLGERVRLILDAGPATVGVESTIVKVDGDELSLLRPGGLEADSIESVAGRHLNRPAPGEAAIEAPGMLRSHYAPEARLRMNASFIEPGEALIAFGGGAVEGAEHATLVFNLSLDADLVEAAANLFDTILQADRVGAGMIAVAPIPETGLGEAINDRLRRAAAPRNA
ncbi:threonylcarbamoyl-AMP synthase [Hoeflea sp. WL0058]|uniref:Threonylcarbamoyl-AMP synthase n=1 Tax=Flavimaribacter sediminis TaxID=2865987 RepID=A0AAE2ZNI2_9HYPH|nr:L-threonylcarbamoyladenylate synthase [Flavimaribacter sediminis]MBW8640174.1 threonylcarbamoyl-AMP synthase [Flavimaribacter sediminis]